MINISVVSRLFAVVVEGHLLRIRGIELISRRFISVLNARRRFSNRQIRAGEGL